MIKEIYVLALAFTLAGCAATHGNLVNPDQLAAFQKGVTSEVEVMRVLGKPIGTTSASDGTRSLIYSSSKYGFGGADMKLNSTVFQFGPDGKMLSYESSEVDYGRFKPQ